MATHGLRTWPWAGAEFDLLPAPERLLIEAWRCWSEDLRCGRPPMSQPLLLLAVEDVPAAAEPLEALMRLARGTPAPLLATRVNDAEAALLLACALAQRGPRGGALAALLRRQSLTTAPMALAAAMRLGTVLRGAGLLLAQPLPRAPRAAPARARSFWPEVDPWLPR